MEQYINKDKVLTEIEILIEEKGSFYASDVLHDLEAFIGTLEAKEMNCEKAIEGLTVGWIEGEEYGELQNVNTNRCVTLNEVKEVMRCTYELGLKAHEEPNLTVDDIMRLDALLISMWQSKSPNKYEEVLKQFKAQKGEQQ